jgi:hypothetical protein
MFGWQMLPVREDEGGNGEEKQMKKKTKGPMKKRVFFSFRLVYCVVF